MDAKQRLRNLKKATWTPPWGGSFQQLNAMPSAKDSAALPPADAVTATGVKTPEEVIEEPEMS